MYRALDAGLRAIDLKTLTEAAESLGASLPRTLFRVILPNLRSAIIGGSLLTVAIALGEFTVASLMGFNTFAVYTFQVGTSTAYEGVALRSSSASCSSGVPCLPFTCSVGVAVPQRA